MDDVGKSILSAGSIFCKGEADGNQQAQHHCDFNQQRNAGPWAVAFAGVQASIPLITLCADRCWLSLIFTWLSGLRRGRMRSWANHRVWFYFLASSNILDQLTGSNCLDP